MGMKCESRRHLTKLKTDQNVCVFVFGSSEVPLEKSCKTLAKPTGLLFKVNILSVLDISWLPKGGDELSWPPLWQSHILPWQEFPVNAGSEGQPAPSCLLRAFLISCPQGTPTAAAAQKSPVHSIFVTTKGKFPWRFVLGKVPLVDSTPLLQHVVLLLFLYSMRVDSVGIWILSVFLFLHFWSYKSLFCTRQDFSASITNCSGTMR